MSSITLDVPDEVAEKLHALADRLPRILDLGLRALSAEASSEYEGVADILEVLATLPTAEEVLGLRAAPTLQHRIQELLEKSRRSGLSPVEQLEWERIDYIEHLVRIAKAKAAMKLKDR
jgi:hypothetical protein